MTKSINNKKAAISGSFFIVVFVLQKAGLAFIINLIKEIIERKALDMKRLHFIV